MQGIKVKYQPSSEFYRSLCERAEQYFREAGKSRRRSLRMYGKTLVIMAWLAVTYVLLVFVATAWWQVVLLSASMVLAIAGVGFNIQHDATHRAYSNKKWVNRLAGLSLDLIGGSSYLWRWRHNVMHHTYPNVVGLDDDINVGSIARMSPKQPWRKSYRFQHLYLWVLYGFVAFRWQLIYDFKEMIQSRIGEIDIRKPGGLETVLFATGKIVFFSLAMIIPMLLHPIWIVLLVYACVTFSVGVFIAVVFQLAHCVEEAEFPGTPPEGELMPTDWAQHQLRTSVDFARSNRLLTWYLGGLNFQAVHHLFPTTCHVHYPALSRILEKTCEQFNTPYKSHRTFRAALASHYRWLKKMGQPDLPAPALA